MHSDILGRSVKTDAKGNFVAPSLDKEEYAVMVTTQPLSPNAENIEQQVNSYEKPPLSDAFVFSHLSIDLRPQDEEEPLSPKPLAITGHPTIPLQYVWIDETKDKSALSYSSLSFHGRFPDSNENWNIQTERRYDPNDQNRQIGTVYLPQGVPITLSGTLLHSVVQDGTRMISQEKQNWALEYRFSPDEQWQPCSEQESTDSAYTHMNATLEPLEEGKNLEIRVR